MSGTESTHKGSERLDRPEKIDDGALLRIRQIRPVEKAAGPIIDQNLELIDWVGKYRPWYRGRGTKGPSELLSRLIDPNENEFCTKLKNFVGTVKRFSPGAFPGHCQSVRMLEFTTVRLLHELQSIVNEDALFTEAVKRVGNMSATLADPSNAYLKDHDLFQRIDARLVQIVESFSDIAAVLRKRERERELEIAFSELPPEPATKEDVETVRQTAERTERKVDIALIKHEETRKAVNRIDARDKRAKKNARRRFSVETQELVFGYWERARRMPEVKALAKRKAGHAHVFTYFKRELTALGIKCPADFDACLRCRSDRIRRNM